MEKRRSTFYYLTTSDKECITIDMVADKLLTMRETAERLGVSKITLRRWDNAGKLPAVRINEQGDRRWKESIVTEFIKKHSTKHHVLTEEPREEDIIEL